MSSSFRKLWLGLAVGISFVMLTACEREERDYAPTEAEKAALGPVPLVTLEPGGKVPPKPNGMSKEYEDNAYHVNQGQQLFVSFNCNGCHGNGGGGSGPALIDDKWIYGGDFSSIAATIRDGRPNGMPSYGRLLAPEQLYQLAAYVRNLGGYVRTDVAPSRADRLWAKPPENLSQKKPGADPVPATGTPPAPR